MFRPCTQNVVFRSSSDRNDEHPSRRSVRSILHVCSCGRRASASANAPLARGGPSSLVQCIRVYRHTPGLAPSTLPAASRRTSRGSAYSLGNGTPQCSRFPERAEVHLEGDRRRRAARWSSTGGYAASRLCLRARYRCSLSQCCFHTRAHIGREVRGNRSERIRRALCEGGERRVSKGRKLALCGALSAVRLPPNEGSGP